MRYTNINGKLLPAADAVVPVDNRALRYGYGVFETILCLDGVLQLKKYHWERLFDGVQRLNLLLPPFMDALSIEQETLKTIKKNNLQHRCRVRIQMFADGGGLYDGTSSRAQYIIECFPLEVQTIKLNEAGLQVGLAENLFKSTDALANLKTCNALLYVMAAQQAKQNKWNDALVCNTDGNVIESTIANIFWIKGDTVYTPPLTEGCIAGVMRRHIMSKIPVVEQTLSPSLLYGADSVFLTNAIRRVKWVNYIGNHSFQLGMIPAIYQKIF
jgi:branched-chain amino acid aminotransferase